MAVVVSFRGVAGVSPRCGVAGLGVVFGGVPAWGGVRVGRGGRRNGGGWVGVAVGGTLLRSWRFWNQSGVRGFGFSSFAVVASTSYFLFQTGCELF